MKRIIFMLVLFFVGCKNNSSTNLHCIDNIVVIPPEAVAPDAIIYRVVIEQWHLNGILVEDIERVEVKRFKLESPTWDRLNKEFVFLGYIEKDSIGCCYYFLKGNCILEVPLTDFPQLSQDLLSDSKITLYTQNDSLVFSKCVQ